MKLALISYLYAAACIPVYTLYIPSPGEIVQKAIGFAGELWPLEDDNPLSRELYLVEFEPGSTRWVTEGEKWDLRRASEPGVMA